MDCTLCQNEIAQNRAKIVLSCSHTFHTKCLTTLFKSMNDGHVIQACPCCKQLVEEDDQMPNYEEQQSRKRAIREDFDKAEVETWKWMGYADSYKAQAEAAKARCSQLELELKKHSSAQ